MSLALALALRYSLQCLVCDGRINEGSVRIATEEWEPVRSTLPPVPSPLCAHLIALRRAPSPSLSGVI